VNPRRSLLAALAAATLCAIGAPASSQAQAFPTKPMKFVVPYSPGGLPDTVARMLAQRLQEALGQTIVIDNRPGANGAVAAAALAGATPDGHTLLVTDGSMLTINPLLYKKLAYDPHADFVPVSLVARSPLFMAVHPSVKAQTFDEFVALVKSKPGAMNYGSSGIGSSHHLTSEAMKAGLGLAIQHIPYRGTANSIPALVGGQVDMVFSALPSLAGFMKSGQVRVLAVNTEKRSSLAPEVPAIAERLPGFDFAVMVIVMAPKGTPDEAITRLSTEIERIAKRPEVIAQMQVPGIEMVGGGPAALTQALKDESARMEKAARLANLQQE
jgi:tripartite-type tricarboxylate transporter receptor subunit TctC